MQANDLEIKVDDHFDKLNHRFERIAWALMAVFLIAAGLGLFGQSSYAWTKLEFGNSVLRYSKFVRLEASTQFIYEIQNAAELETIWVSHDLLSHYKFESVTPTPVESISKDGGIEFQFKTRGGSFQAVFSVIPNEAGRLSGQLKPQNFDLQTISQFSYF